MTQKSKFSASAKKCSKESKGKKKGHYQSCMRRELKK